MVLENAASSDTFTDTLATSDIDPYSSEPTPPRQRGDSLLVAPYSFRDGQFVNEPIYVNLNQLPRRWSLLVQKPHPKALLDGIVESCRFAQGVLQRPVTQDEADAFAFHFAKSLSIGSYGTPIGVVAGTAMAAKGWEKMRFPFWWPFKEGSMWSKDAFGPLRGQAARAMWHGLRVSAYSLVGATIGQIFFGSYALSVSLAGRAMDPRLKEFTQALQQRAKDGRGRSAAQAIGKTGNQEAGAKDGETYDMARQRRGVQDLGRPRGEQRVNYDDASPTGGMFADEYMDQDAQQPGFMSEQEVRQRVDDRLGSGENEDDAGPYAQSSTVSRTGRQDNSTAGPSREDAPKKVGSAWDRLRQEAMSGAQKRAHKGTVPSPSAGSSASASGSDKSSPGDTFSFSSADEDRQLAKSDAQKDFDARVELEREGRDFDDRPAGRGRWG